MSKPDRSFLFPTKTSSWVYTMLYPWVSKGVDLFVGDLAVVGLQNIPADGPLMLIANHQNAMFDPLICCKVFPRQLHWLTRSDVFKNKKIASFLHSIHMLPIYREKDQVVDQLERNEEVFKVCRERLSKGAVIAMFPEGSHRGKKQLMTPLKKGFARLAFSSIEKDPRLMNLKILPMAIDYSSFVDYQPVILLKIGEPIPLKNFWQQYSEDANKAVSQLVKEAADALSSLMVDIKCDEHYDELIALTPLFYHNLSKNRHDGFARFQRLVNDWSALKDDRKKEYLRYVQITKEMGITVNSLEMYEVAQWRFHFSYGIEWLPAALGRLAYGPLYWFTEKFIQKNVKDELFYNSIRLAFFTFLTPIYWLMMIGITYWLLPEISALELVIVFLFFLAIGLFSLSWNKTKKIREDFLMANRAQRRFPELWQEAMELKRKIQSNE